jgi:hypothetical protein
MTRPSEQIWQEKADAERLRAEWPVAKSRDVAHRPAPEERETPSARARPIVPAGLRYTMLLAALLKHILQDDETLKAQERLDLLEKLTGLVGDGLTPDMLQAIEPMCKVAVQMLDSAESLDKHAKPPRHVSFNMLVRDDVFNHFLALNGGMRKAIEMSQRAA